MNTRKLNVASLMINLTVLILTAYSVAHNFRTDIIRETQTVNDTALTNFTGFASFRYFTTLSNVFAAVSAAVILFFNVKNAVNDEYLFPKWAVIVKYMGTCAVTLTFATVALFLSPVLAFNGASYFLLFQGNGFFFHFLIPVLSVCGFTLCEKTPELDFGFTFVAAIPTVIYATVYTVMVALIKSWPDFYGFTFNGTYWLMAITVFVMCAGSFGLCVLVRFLRRKLIPFPSDKE